MTAAGKVGAALFCLVLLAGCAGGGWAKPGADPAEVARAHQDCSEFAATATDKDVGIDQDILASRGADADRSGAVRTDNRLMQDDTSRYGEKIIAACMKQKGYTERH